MRYLDALHPTCVRSCFVFESAAILYESLVFGIPAQASGKRLDKAWDDLLNVLKVNFKWHN
jgi:hypothetical protein